MVSLTGHPILIGGPVQSGRHITNIQPVSLLVSLTGHPILIGGPVRCGEHNKYLTCVLTGQPGRSSNINWWSCPMQRTHNKYLTGVLTGQPDRSSNIDWWSCPTRQTYNKCVISGMVRPGQHISDHVAMFNIQLVQQEHWLYCLSGRIM